MLRSKLTGRRRVLALLGTVGMMSVLALAVIAPPMAIGQATRTWVSGIGDDANPCARTAPCKTFAGAISKTATGGEINCMDPGGFGGVTITKSLTIDCTGTIGGVLAAGAGVNGIVINLPSTNDQVTLRGLDLNGAGNAQNGIRMVSGGTLHVEDVAIRGFRATNGLGMSLQPAGAAEIDIRNSSITDNGTLTTGGGILIQPTSNGSAKVTLTDVDLSNNFHGLRADSAGSTTNSIKVSITDSSATGNTQHGFAAVTSAGSGPVEMLIDSSLANYNGSSGVVAGGANTLIRLSRSSITGNAGGTTQVSGGVIESYQTNQIRSNTNNGTRVNIVGE